MKTHQIKMHPNLPIQTNEGEPGTMTRQLALLFLLMIALAVGVPIRAEDVPLPEADWYGVIWHSDEDTLHWVNPAGAVASIPRPRLPDEPLGSQPSLALSPDGAVLLVVAPVAQDRTQLGFYDLAAGRFLQIHQTAPGERVDVASFASRGDELALSFNTPGTLSWRLILFNWRSGDALAQLSSADPIAVVAAPRRAAQIVTFEQDETGARLVHFHLVSVESADRQPLAWAIDEASLAPSSYTDASSDRLYSTGEAVFSYADGRFPVPDGGGGAAGNAIGRGSRLNPTPVIADGLTLKRDPRWLRGGAWVGYLEQTEAETRWVALPVDAPQRRLTLSPEIVEIRATPDGWLGLRRDGAVVHATSIIDSAGFELLPDAAGQVQIVGITPETVTPALASLAVPDPAQPPTATPTPQILACEGAPAPRMAPGDQGEVIGTVPLRVRAEPGGQYLGEMPVGTRFSVTGLPACANGFLWWPVMWSRPDLGELRGWSAEGDATDYYMQPLAPLPTPTPAPSATATPLPEMGAPFAPPTITPTPGG